MKYLLIVVCVVCCIMAGLLCGKHLKKKARFYSDLCLFCEDLMLEIKGKLQTLPNFVSTHKNMFGKEFSLVLDKYEDYLSGKIEQKEFFDLEISSLSSNEVKDVCVFLMGLGNFLTEEELAKLQVNKSKFQLKSKACDESKNKFYGTYMKLFVVAGIAFAIIFL